MKPTCHECTEVKEIVKKKCMVQAALVLLVQHFGMQRPERSLAYLAALELGDTLADMTDIALDNSQLGGALRFFLGQLLD